MAKYGLIDRAKVNIERCEDSLKKSDDELYLDEAGYQLQQGVEKCIKQLFEFNGYMDYPYTHDIGRLLTAGKEHLIELPKWISERADAITVLESSTRYAGNIVGTKTLISELLPKLKSLWVDVNNMAVKQNVNTVVEEIKRENNIEELIKLASEGN